LKRTRRLVGSQPPESPDAQPAGEAVPAQSSKAVEPRRRRSLLGRSGQSRFPASGPQPDASDSPNASDASDVPDVPDASDVPDAPDAPDEPDAPDAGPEPTAQPTQASPRPKAPVGPDEPAYDPGTTGPWLRRKGAPADPVDLQVVASSSSADVEGDSPVAADPTSDPTSRTWVEHLSVSPNFIRVDSTGDPRPRNVQAMIATVTGGAVLVALFVLFSLVTVALGGSAMWWALW
jgi:hypothetical protein